MTLKAISIAPGNYQNPAELDRVLVDTLARRTAGVIFEDVTIPDLKINPGTGHTFDVAVGKAVVREKTNPTIRGGYFFQNDAVLNIALGVPDSQPRIDTVIVRVTDPQYGVVTGAVGPRIDIVSGTPASSPVAVSDGTIDAVSGTPGGWTRLCDIRVNTADVGTVPVGQFTDKRLAGGFGTINCTLATRPIGYNGLRVWRLDALSAETYSGTAWIGGTGSLPAAAVSGGSGTTCPASGAETKDDVMGDYTFAAIAGHRYMIWVTNQVLTGSVAGDRYVAIIREGAAAIVATETGISPGGANRVSANITGTAFFTTGSHTLSLFLRRMSGSGTANLLPPYATAVREMFVVDMGIV